MGYPSWSNALLKAAAFAPLASLSLLTALLFLSFELLPDPGLAIVAAGLLLPFLVAPIHLWLTRTLSPMEKTAWWRLFWSCRGIWGYLLARDRKQMPAVRSGKV